MSRTFTCPRCFFSGRIAPALRYCPRCGLDGVAEAAADTSPLEIGVHGRTYRVMDRLAIGSACNIYRCRFQIAPPVVAAPTGLPPPLPTDVEGVLKIARDARSNSLVDNEAAALRRLYAADPEGRFTRFIPMVQESLAVADGSGGKSQPRQANVLKVHEDIRSPDALYSLEEVRGVYPAGLDPRDMAWVWRRLLSVLGFAHANGVTHAAVLPMHVLVEPTGHKLVLIDWCAAAHGPDRDRKPVSLLSAGHAAWYGRSALRQPATPMLDVALGVRCMIYLLGGDAVQAEFPPGTDPALERYFKRCLGLGMNGPSDAPSPAIADAWKLLEDFDKLIEALWGPRQFRVLSMPAKRIHH